MSARQPRFEVVHSDAGWFARFVAANGQTVWVTETYTRERGAWRAIDLLGATSLEIRQCDERTPPPPTPDITARAFGGWI